MKLSNFYYSSSDRNQRSLMLKLKNEGKIRKIGPRLFTSLAESKIEDAVMRSWSEILANLFPGSHLAYRTAIEFKPNDEGFVFISSDFNRKISYAGLTFKFIKGTKSLDSDKNYLGTLKVSSFERALLENLTGESKIGKCVEQDIIERKLEEVLSYKGESALNEIREVARGISTELKLLRSFKILNEIIGALLGTKPAKSLCSEQGRSRSENNPYDITCLAKLEILFGELRTSSFMHFKELNNSNDHFINKAFFESYFSNYIEGTTFEIEEAEEIIFDNKLVEHRLQDSHDILGTFQVVSDKEEMLETPKDMINFVEILKRRHIKMMGQRKDISPGEFKEKPNRAGSTHFVAPQYVSGSLDKGLQLYLKLEDPVSRAIFISFLISEVHPFNDGNGRLSRVMFNSEMIKAGLSTIIIPNVYREDYLLSLRAMSRRERPMPLIKMFRSAQKFSVVDFSNYQNGLEYLVEHNWFLEPSEGKIFRE